MGGGDDGTFTDQGTLKALDTTGTWQLNPVWKVIKAKSISSFRTVTDGTSNTAVFGEKHVAPTGEIQKDGSFTLATHYVSNNSGRATPFPRSLP